ncbi:MAG: hypothetical protein Q8891_02700 [Bacteroidota bacterium]|nr:hypothetical protein [Bacteroidota bacterium]
MQDIEDNIDDLFKRAAENYPLQTGNGDWESISKKISVNSLPKGEIIPVKKNPNKNIILSFILIGLFLLSWLVIHNSKQYLPDMPTIVTTIKNNAVRSDNEVTVMGNSQKDTNRYLHNSIIKNFGNYKIKGQAISNSIYSTTTKKETEIFSHLIKKKDKIANNFYLDKNATFNSTYTKPVWDSLNPHKTPGTEIVKNLLITKVESAETFESKSKLISKAIPPVGKYNLDSNKAANILSKKKGLYIGLITGPDFSKVESSPFGSPGYSTGIFLGLKINSRLSFETGIIHNKKNYSSDGSIFNMEKIGNTMPTGMVIKNLKSQSALWEFPLKIEYDFYTHKNSIFFISGGTSIYVMTKEKNKYNVTMNGSPEKMEGIYQKSNFRFPAVSIISIGFEHQLYRLIELRIEPYLKIPLQGIGVGRLPVTSLGIQFGILRRLK